MKTRKTVLIPLTGPSGSNSSLGNQLFQLSLGIFISRHLNLRVKYYMRSDISGKGSPMQKDTQPLISTLISADDFIPEGFLKEFSLRLALKIPLLTFSENDLCIDKTRPLDLGLFKSISNGYFQNYKIVEEITDELLNRFKSSNFFNSAFGTSANRIALHVRYGDYVSNSKNRSIYGTINPEYYVSSVKFLMSELGINNATIFSDNPKFALSNLTPGLSSIPNLSVEVYSSSTSEDFNQIALSKGVVISNSTFAWWAGWLGHIHNSTRVIYPSPWFSTPQLTNSDFAWPTWNPMIRSLDL
jgi:hypothetical protein